MSLIRQIRPGTDELTSRRMNTRSVPVVTLVADLTTAFALFTGQVVLCLEDGLLYRWDGSAWVGVVATGGGFRTVGTDAPIKSHEARYYNNVAQPIPNVTDTKVQFPSVFANSSNDVTPSGTGNTDFLLKRAGLWFISAGIRYLGIAGGLERHLFLQTGSVFNTANRFSFRTAGNVGSFPISLATSSAIRVAANTTIIVGAFQNSGSALNTDPWDAATVHGGTHLCLVWLRP